VKLVEAATNLKDYLDLSEETIKGLISIELLSRAVTRTQIVGVKSIEELERDGLLFLAPKDDMFTIHIPWFTFHILYPESKPMISPPKLLRSTSYLLESKANEISDLALILIKLDLLLCLGHKTFHLGDLFPLHPKAENKEFTIPDHLAYEGMDKQVHTWTSQKFGTELTRLEKTHCAAYGCGNDSFPDAWIVVRPPGSTQRHLLYIQSKMRKNVGGAMMTPGLLKKEHDKCLFFKKHHTFILISDNRPRTDEPYAANEIIIDSTLHDQFYGRCLALRRKNLM